METREILLKADKVSVVFERIADGKIRVTTSSWDDAKVIWPNPVLEVATIGKQVGLVRVDKPIAYLDIDDTGLDDIAPAAAGEMTNTQRGGRRIVSSTEVRRINGRSVTVQRKRSAFAIFVGG